MKNSRVVYVGFLDNRPHVERQAGARMIAVYVSRAAARRAYQDVRGARLVFGGTRAKGRRT